MTGAPERMHYSTEGVCIVPPRTRYAVVIATPTGAIPMPFLADVVLESLPFGGGVVSVVRDGVSLGAVIAVVCSWQRNRSILWAILAGLLSWVYVVYFAITRQPGETRSGF